MIEVLKQALEALENNRQTHRYCEDTWYSCPKHEDGCANDSEGNECNCGADEANIKIDAAIASLRQAIKELESQEPVAWPCLIAEADFSQDTVTLTMQCDDYKVSAGKHWLSTHPPQLAQNFCPRCGKRTNDIHTCTPPMDTQPIYGIKGGLAHDAQNKENT
jgi:hypothetical protein